MVYPVPPGLVALGVASREARRERGREREGGRESERAREIFDHAQTLGYVGGV